MNVVAWKTSMTGAVLTALLWTAVARGEETVSPRGFCQAGGGVVVETGDPAVHRCCREEGQRCIEVNERSRASVRVPGRRPDTVNATRSVD